MRRKTKYNEALGPESPRRNIPPTRLAAIAKKLEELAEAGRRRRQERRRWMSNMAKKLVDEGRETLLPRPPMPRPKTKFQASAAD
jgi:hypothetical protein